jgi:flagellar motor switch protein FliG
MSNEQNSEKGIYINGKQQAIELLQALAPEERKKLLRNMSARNVVMTRELSEQCFSFRDLEVLTDQDLTKVLRMTNPIIIGLAITLSPRKFQRKALSLMERTLAEQAYEIMTKDLSSKRNECFRAQQKMLDTAIQLSRKKIISFH